MGNVGFGSDVSGHECPVRLKAVGLDKIPVPGRRSISALHVVLSGTRNHTCILWCIFPSCSLWILRTETDVELLILLI